MLFFRLINVHRSFTFLTSVATQTINYTLHSINFKRVMFGNTWQLHWPSKCLASPADILSGSSRNHSSPHERLLQRVATSVQANWPITGRLPFFVKRDFDLKFISRVHVNMRTSLRSSILCPRNFVFWS